MPTRFSTEAANADSMGDDTDATTGAPKGMPDEVGADGTPRDRSDRGSGRGQAEEGGTREPRDGEARPGKDINAPGFLKDKNAAKP
jgi:hypothetical protein